MLPVNGYSFGMNFGRMLLQSTQISAIACYQLSVLSKNLHISMTNYSRPKPKKKIVDYTGIFKGIDWVNMDSEKWKKLNFPITKDSPLVERKFFLNQWSLLKAGNNLEEMEYTAKPLTMHKHGGRGPDGKMWIKRKGGGHKQRFRWVDVVRCGPEDGSVLQERVCQVRYDPLRSADIALVAGGTRRRWIVATDGLKIGDIIGTCSQIPRMAVRPKTHDAWPLGALPLGTFVCCVEKLPGKGARIATAAGTQCQLVHKVGGRAIVRMPSKREINVSEQCMAVVGRVSNPDHNKEIIGSPNRARWFGIRPGSGLWHRKDGRYGRKIKPIKPAVIVRKPPPPPKESYTLGHE